MYNKSSLSVHTTNQLSRCTVIVQRVTRHCAIAREGAASPKIVVAREFAAIINYYDGIFSSMLKRFFYLDLGVAAVLVAFARICGRATVRVDVYIIKDSDIPGPENRGCTVATP